MAMVRSPGVSAKTRRPLSASHLPKLVLLQLLRALAALSVAMLHAQHDAAALAERTGRAFAPLTAFPWEAGVDVFFVISGFIMVHASARLFGTAEGRRVFLARRIARIVPIYWAVTTLYLAIALAAPALLNVEFIGWERVLASYLFIPLARPDGVVQPLYGLGWTLNYEMFFYALFALAIVRPRWRAVLGLAAALIVLVIVGRLFYQLPQPLGFWTDPIILEFVYGMGLALLHAQGARLGGSARALLAAGAVIVLTLALALPLSPQEILAYRSLLFGVPAAMLVAAVAFGGERAEEGRLARMGAAIGDASYALYLIHPFVIRAGRELALRSGLAIGPWLFIALALAAAIAASLLVYRLFERPLTTRLRARLEGGRAASAGVAVYRSRH
jgi:exopolysaccharide production protein ExoZ